MKKKNKNSIVFEVILLIIGLSLSGILLIANSVTPFLNDYLFLGLLVMSALCAAALIATVIIYRKIHK